MTYNIDPYEYEYMKNVQVFKPIIKELAKDPCIFNSITKKNKPETSILHITKKPPVNKYKKPTVSLNNNILASPITPHIKPKKQVSLVDLCKEPVAKVSKLTVSNNPILNQIIDKVVQMMNSDQNKIKLLFNNKNGTVIKVDPDYDYSYVLTPPIIKMIETTLLKNTLGDILNLITQSKKDEDVSGNETAVYKDTDGTLKTININEISKLIFDRVSSQLVSEYDKVQDTNISNINLSVNDIQDGLKNIDLWEEFTEN